MIRHQTLVAGAVLALALGLTVGAAQAVDLRVGGIVNVNRSSLTTDHPDYGGALENYGAQRLWRRARAGAAGRGCRS